MGERRRRKWEENKEDKGKGRGTRKMMRESRRSGEDASGREKKKKARWKER